MREQDKDFQYLQYLRDQYTMRSPDHDHRKIQEKETIKFLIEILKEELVLESRSATHRINISALGKFGIQVITRRDNHNLPRNYNRSIKRVIKKMLDNDYQSDEVLEALENLHRKLNESLNYQNTIVFILIVLVISILSVIIIKLLETAINPSPNPTSTLSSKFICPEDAKKSINKTITIVGSNSAGVIKDALQHSFSKVCRDFKVETNSKQRTSGDGIKQVRDSVPQQQFVAFSSADVGDIEKYGLIQGAIIDQLEKPVMLIGDNGSQIVDEIVFFTTFSKDPETQIGINSFSSEQIIDLLTCNNIKKWSDIKDYSTGVTGTNKPIYLILKPKNSGTRITLKAKLLGPKREFCNDENMVITTQEDSTQEMLNDMDKLNKEGKIAIGYMGVLNLEGSDIKFFKIDNKSWTDTYYPSKLTRNFYFVYKQHPTAGVQAFVDYMRSSEGRKVISDAINVQRNKVMEKSGEPNPESSNNK